MVGKLTAALIRKEAEAYRAQGLHEEAFALYDELLSSSPNIDEALKSDIQSQMDDITEEMEAFSSHEEGPSMSSKEIMQLKDGWTKNASSAEILISAQGLCQIGAHRDALPEFAKLLKAGIAPDKIADSAADCFANMHSPQKAPQAAEKWLANIYSEAKKILAMHLLVIKALSKRKDKKYALEYCHFIRSKPKLPAKLIKQLDAAKIKYQRAVKASKQQLRSKINPNNTIQRAPVTSNQVPDKSNGQGNRQSNDDAAAASFEKLVATDETFRELLADDELDGMFRDEPSSSSPKKNRPTLQFFKLITVGWIHWIFNGILFRKKR